MNLGHFGRQTIAAPIAALTLVAGGGIALAASGGADPAPQAAEHRQVGKPSAEPKANPTKDDSDEQSSDASPSPSLTGLCKAYRAGGYASSTKNGRVNPAWSGLESAAGGESDVDDYCDERLEDDAEAKADRKGKDEDDADNPGKGPKSAKPHQGDNDDDSDDERGSRGLGHDKD